MRDVVVLLGVICLLPVALVRPWIGFLGFTLIGLWNPHKFTWYLKDMRIALMVAAATLIGLVLTKDRKGVAWSRELVLMIVFALYFTITTQFAWAPEAAAAQLDQNIRVYFMIFIMGTLIYGEQKIRAMLLVIILGIGLFGVKGGIFSILTGGQYHVVGPETTFLEANTSLGLAFNMILPLLLVTAQEQTVKWRALAFYGSAFLTFLATIFTYSRGAWIGLAATVPFLLLRIKHGVLIGVLMIPVGLVGIAFIPDKVFNRAETIGSYQEDNSAMTRIQAWSVAFNVAKDHPFVGGGFDYENYPDPNRWLGYADRKYDSVDQTPRAAHSIYFQVLGQHGFVGFGIFMTLMGLTFLSFSGIARDVRNIPELGWLGRYAKAMQVGMIGYLVSGAFLNLAYFDLIYLYIGLIAIFRREIREFRVANPATAGASSMSMVAALVKKPMNQSG